MTRILRIDSSSRYLAEGSHSRRVADRVNDPDMVAAEHARTHAAIEAHFGG